MSGPFNVPTRLRFCPPPRQFYWYRWAANVTPSHVGLLALAGHIHVVQSTGQSFVSPKTRRAYSGSESRNTAGWPCTSYNLRSISVGSRTPQ